MMKKLPNLAMLIDVLFQINVFWLRKIFELLAWLQINYYFGPYNVTCHKIIDKFDDIKLFNYHHYNIGVDNLLSTILYYSSQISRANPWTMTTRRKKLNSVILYINLPRYYRKYSNFSLFNIFFSCNYSSPAYLF